MSSRSALYVTSATSVNGRPGGQQVFTAECLKVMAAAGFSVDVMPYTWDRRLHVRIKRKLWPRPYRDSLLPSLADDVVAAVRSRNIPYVFLTIDSAPLATGLRQTLGSGVTIILLSAGLASVDYLHEMRARGSDAPFSHTGGRDLKKLARQLSAECVQRQAIDHVFCLAPFEAEIERWLGARNVTWLPRTVPDRPLDWKPHAGRMGFVGTLNHAPNVEGLLLFLEELRKIAPPSVRFRLVGGPATDAAAIASRFPMVEYVGNIRTKRSSGKRAPGAVSCTRCSTTRAAAAPSSR